MVAIKFYTHDSGTSTIAEKLQPGIMQTNEWHSSCFS